VPTDLPIRGRLRVMWDASRQSRYWVLSGTRTALDGTVLATKCGPPYNEQARSHLADINRRRSELGLKPIIIDEI